MFGIEQLIVWREASALAAKIEIAVAGMRGVTAKSSANQLVRAADSIAANVAEGYGRGIRRDGLRFFRMAKSSADEVENHLRRAGQSNRLPAATVANLVDHTIRVRYLILRYAASVERRIEERKKKTDVKEARGARKAREAREASEPQDGSRP
jgi:four helix bundle protein